MATASATAKIWYLKQINLFKGISMEEMEQVAKMVVEKTFRRKEKVYLPGEPGQSIYLIKKGVVKISKITPDGRGLTLAFLKPGEIFGEKESWMFPVKPLWLKTPKLSKLFPHRCFSPS